MGNKSDAALALFVVAVACMLLVPLPTPLLDLLLVINLSFSILVLLVALYMQSALSLLTFPAILLLSTLFRLGLNVASSRLILSQGEAGQVIDAFGNLLIRGEVIVGVIIFTIVTIVNFIVIARGATRVSEVAARFSLDALPGKQMAIDSDVRAGLCTAQEAQRKRDDLRKESQLYGSMDGAMKFVQGDAIAGVCIILTNIFGGLYLGISRGQSLEEAMHTYTVLTIGDGLVSQIPALLTSICAGIVVTRVSSGDSTTLGGEIQTQLFTQPRTLVVTAVLVSIVGLLPGLPVLPFLAVAIVLTSLAYIMQRAGSENGRVIQPKREQLGSAQLPALYAPLEDEAFDKEAIVLKLDSIGLYPLYRANQSRYRQFWSDLTQDVYAYLGVTLPVISVTSSESLGTLCTEAIIQETTIDSLSAVSDALVVEVNPESAFAYGLHVIGELMHPIDGNRISWCENTALLRNLQEGGMVRALDAIEFSYVRIAGHIRNHPEFFVSSAEIHTALKGIDKRHPGFLAESLNREFLPTTRITEICHELLRDGLSIRDLRNIVEVLSSYCSTEGKDFVQDGVYDRDHIVQYFRRSRRKTIVGNRLTRMGALRVITVHDEVESLFETLKKNGNVDQRRVTAQLQNLVQPIQRRGLLPVSVLCRSESRSAIAAFIHQQFPYIGVFSYDELDSKIQLQYAGQW